MLSLTLNRGALSMMLNPGKNTLAPLNHTEMEPGSFTAYLTQTSRWEAVGHNEP